MQPLDEAFLDWCREELRFATQQLEGYRSGRLTMRSNDEDVSAEEIAHKERVIRQMNAILNSDRAASAS